MHRLAPDDKKQITLLICASAEGTFQNPYVIFPGKKEPKFNLTEVNASDFDLGFSPKGWISSEAFFERLANIFFPNVKDKMPFPIIIFWIVILLILIMATGSIPFFRILLGRTASPHFPQFFSIFRIL